MSPAQNSSTEGCPHAAGRQLFTGVRTTGPVDCKWSLTDKSVADPHPHQVYKYDWGARDEQFASGDGVTCVFLVDGMPKRCVGGGRAKYRPDACTVFALVRRMVPMCYLCTVSVLGSA